MSFPNILISIKKFDYHLLISQIKRKNVVNRKEVRSEECDEHTAKKKSPGYIIDFEAKKIRFTLFETPEVSQKVFQIWEKWQSCEG